MIRIDALWLAVEPMDMRVGVERLLARVVQVFGQARAHHDYLFANTRPNRVKLLVHDGFGVWRCGRRLNAGGLMWPKASEHRISHADAAAVRRARAWAAVAAVAAVADHHSH